ncbi:MAG: hypothetical protein ACE5FS_04175 [Paracoccaceae bacterium]
MPVLSAFVGAGLFYAWLQSDEGYLTAETGAGYYLGIAGSVLMLALLLYPLRKRIRALSVVGEVRTWFRLHMVLGVVGPALVVLHSNFSAGSANSAIALFSMLLVAGSGYIGRFLYAHIHRGLYGRKLQVRELLDDTEVFKSDLAFGSPELVEIAEFLEAYEARRLRPASGLLDSLWRLFASSAMRHSTRRRVNRMLCAALETCGEREDWRVRESRKRIATATGHLRRFFRAVARAEVFLLYERLFALWHMLHLPLFIILIIAALGHVVAVHLY